MDIEPNFFSRGQVAGSRTWRAQMSILGRSSRSPMQGRDVPRHLERRTIDWLFKAELTAGTVSLVMGTARRSAPTLVAGLHR